MARLVGVLASAYTVRAVMSPLIKGGPSAHPAHTLALHAQGSQTAPATSGENPVCRGVHARQRRSPGALGGLREASGYGSAPGISSGSPVTIGAVSEGGVPPSPPA